ncbi:hydantoinase/oxoprolinase family protein [Alteromonas sp. KUL49]|uniref:hydantoinase/oxoprolinase family protein n=1 Tax=Alteromonas sp. KUL49 TaxID=2480798 RepID=UPI00102EFBC6|nr:hydantoinase/oxoprolinase family protein [Alteromonas sp. KUL49]TAP38653.1 hydantoinase/oxoprolinase family protein [Alteromonas sp. KUL49]GEA12598.1 5-oxoprolinase [Alteromonas sp. KUL49]
MSYRLGVDVGGTFTDLLLINEDTGQTYTAKVPSTPHDSSVGVLNGIDRICEESGVPVSNIHRVMHGTTVATNAVLTGKGAKVALVTTKGYKQVLQVARSFCPGGLGGWVSYVKKPLLAPLELTVEADERIDAKGDVVKSLDEAALIETLKSLKEKGGFTALTISFINAYVNGVNEQRAREVAKTIFPDMPISISCEVVPELQEYERTETTVVNSYVRPEVAKYVDNLYGALTEKMGDNLHLSILRSDGGLASARSAADSPVNLLMSGPAGGVAGAIHFCKQGGFDDILTFDMGGTSTDVALIQNATARVRRETRVGDVTVRAPSVDVRTVGAGGGSLAFVPELTKALRVGPESAGAKPGPAAYMKGGEEPTVCDANVVLGYLPADVQLGGKMSINRDAAVAAVKKVADAMEISVEEAAEGIIKIANEAMFGALRLVSVEQGFDPREFALVGFGGAGPLHANALGILTQAWPAIIPPGPGVLCAYGDATTQVRNEASQTLVSLLSDVSIDKFKDTLQSLAEKASSTLIADGIDASEQEITFQADIRYTGQAFQLCVPFTMNDLDEQGLDLLKAQFDAEHTQLFTFALEEGHEVVMVRAIATAKSTPLPTPPQPDGSYTLADCEITHSKIYYEGQYHEAVIYDRSKLHSDLVVTGPAIVCEMDSTTVVLPGFVANVDSVGNLLITPETQA